MLKIGNNPNDAAGVLDVRLIDRAAGCPGSAEGPGGRDGALEKVRDAKESISRTTFRMWDRHAEMVKKSQELNKARIRKDAIARRNRYNREMQTELLAERALENARRSQWLDAAALKRRDQEDALRRS